jgi:hypothetical protein
MKAAFIVMSILGCDDSGSQCQSIQTVDRQWTTIASCDSASEAELGKFTNAKFPMIVAVCQTANSTALDDSEEDVAETADEVASRALPVAPTPPAITAEAEGLTDRAISIAKKIVPCRKGMLATLEKPVHFVTGTYSWVAHKVAD